MEEIDLKTLFEQALEASKNAYAPYSHFPVGAALLLANGTVISGANVENRSFGLTNCAERTAIFEAVAKGCKEFKAIAIATPSASYPVGPCGACRQVLSEFSSANTPVIFGSEYGNTVITTLGQLYPFDSLHELKD